MANRAIRRAAEEGGISVRQCRREIQEALDEAWENAQQNPELKAKWKKYFSSGEKPTLEDFMAGIAEAYYAQNQAM